MPIFNTSYFVMHKTQMSKSAICKLEYGSCVCTESLSTWGSLPYRPGARGLGSRTDARKYFTNHASKVKMLRCPNFSACKTLVSLFVFLLLFFLLFFFCFCFFVFVFCCCCCCFCRVQEKWRKQTEELADGEKRKNRHCTCMPLSPT